MPAARGRQRRSRDKRPSSVKSEREELLTLLREDSVHGRSEPLAEGAPGPGRTDLPSVTLTTRGAELAGRCLLRLLEPFEGRQLVAVNPSAMPLLQACVMLSRGQYRGLLVHPEVSRSPVSIEGRLDPTEPVVLVGELLSDGIEEAALIARLAQNGLWVEGGVYLARMGYVGAASRLRVQGVPTVTLFELDELHSERAGPEAFGPGPQPPEGFAQARVPEGLQPVELVRRAIAEAVRTRKLLRPPRRVAGQFTAAGGLWIRVRPRDAADSTGVEHGFWHFPGEKAPALPVALTRAGWLAGTFLERMGAEPLAALEQSTVSVRFCSALEPCELGQLDPERYGVVVRSRERPDAVGEAPPRMPGITNAWQQFEHARTQSAQLLPEEPFLLYRYKLQEASESATSAPVREAPRARAAPAKSAVPKSPAAGASRLIPSLCKFLLRHLGSTARYEPLTDTTHAGLDTARLAHQAWTLARAHRKLGPAQLGDGARTLLTALTSDLVVDEAEHVWIRADEGPSISQVAFTLLTQLELGEDMATAKALASTLWSRIGPHGRLGCLLNPTADDEACQDSMPGQALLALARAAEARVHPVDEVKLAQAWRYYRHRFRYRHHWDQVPWLTQAAAAWWRVDRDAERAHLAFEVCDWALGYQSEKTGAFLNDHQPDTPGATTTLYLEALAASAGLASSLKDRARNKRYLEASARAVAFLDSLVLQESDVKGLPNARQALGGVRMSRERGEVQVDFVQHALSALLGLAR
ncbi:MAG TPA: hypothetical protein VK539_13815 [Myxococcaceae bacterium]|nr:hypothetical protein [Myxococcaceae bacterium]